MLWYLDKLMRLHFNASFQRFAISQMKPVDLNAHLQVNTNGFRIMSPDCGEIH